MSDFQTPFESAFTAKFSLFDVDIKKSEKSPDKTGSIEIEIDEAMKLAEYLTAQPGEPSYGGKTVIKIPVSAWNTESKNGLRYLYGSVWAKKPESTVNDKPIF
jgi:hypothetical protein